MQSPIWMAVVSQQVIKLLQLSQECFFPCSMFFTGNKEMRTDKERMPVLLSWWTKIGGWSLAKVQNVPKAHTQHRHCLFCVVL